MVCVGAGGRHDVSDLPPARPRISVFQSATVRLAERQLPARVHQGAVLLFEDDGHRRRRSYDRRCPCERRSVRGAQRWRQTVETMQTATFADRRRH